MKNCLFTNKYIVNLIFIILILNIIGCDNLAWLFQEYPDDYDYHTHNMFIYYEVVDTLMNKNNDSIIRVEFDLNQYEYSRSPQQYDGLSYFCRDFPRSNKIILSNQDTATKVCITEIAHFTGFQLQYGGDTTRFSTLDSKAGWDAYIRASDGFVYLSNGRKVPLSSKFRKKFPDWLRSPYMIKIQFIWNGLISGDTNQLQLQFNSDNVSIRQLYP